MGKHCVKYKKKFCPRFKISARSILISNLMLTTEPKLFPFKVKGADNFYKYFWGSYHYPPPREIVTRKILNDKKLLFTDDIFSNLSFIISLVFII